MSDLLDFPQKHRETIEPYLFTDWMGKLPDGCTPWVTLTYASSLDSKISLHQGVQTALSGPQSKAMTHYLRSRHDVILVGSGTAIADDPSLNCRLRDAKTQPRPVIIDRGGRWEVNEQSKVIQIAKAGKGQGPWIFSDKVDEGKRKIVEAVGGRIVQTDAGASFESVVEHLGKLGIRSIMVEGGGILINDLLTNVNIRAGPSSMIVTIAPTILGDGGVAVSPMRRSDAPDAPVVKLSDVEWLRLGQDSVMLGLV